MKRCANCGHDAKVEHTINVRGTLAKDDYCGHCGVNWGVIKKPAKQKPKRAVVK